MSACQQPPAPTERCPVERHCSPVALDEQDQGAIRKEKNRQQERVDRPCENAPAATQASPLGARSRGCRIGQAAMPACRSKRCAPPCTVVESSAARARTCSRAFVARTATPIHRAAGPRGVRRRMRGMVEQKTARGVQRQRVTERNSAVGRDAAGHSGLPVAASSGIRQRPKPNSTRHRSDHRCRREWRAEPHAAQVKNQMSSGVASRSGPGGRSAERIGSVPRVWFQAGGHGHTQVFSKTARVDDISTWAGAIWSVREPAFAQRLRSIPGLF